MSELWQQFHFLRPGWLLALLALPLLLILAARRSTAREALMSLVDADLLPHLLQGHEHKRRLPFLLLAVAWSLCALAMAGPTWSRVAQPLYAQRAAQVVALSLSQDMLARDVAPSRLDRARYKVRDLFAANHDGLNALLAYAGEAFVVAPLTTDAGSLNDLLDALAPDTMPVEGDNAAQAIERGVTLISDAKAGGGSLVLVTDNVDASARAAARKALSAGVRVSVLGVGTTQGGPVPLADESFLRDARGALRMAHRDDEALQALATTGGGIYVPMSDGHTDIDALRGELRADGKATLAGDQRGDEWQDRGPWLLLPLLPLLAMTFRRGWLVLLPLVLLPSFPGAARASTWSDLWQRPDQQAATALSQGRAKEAQQLARDPAWRGVAAYRAGDFADAATALKQSTGVDAQYNLGNALAKRGDYQGALDAYDRALKSSPANADALANRKVVEDWLRHQQQNQSQDKGAPNEKNNSGQGKQNKPSNDAQGQSGQQQNSADQKDGQGNSAQDAQGDSQGANKDAQGKGQDQDKNQDQAKQANDTSQTKPQTPQEQAEQRAREEQAQQALQKQMDKALGKPGQDHQPSTHELGAVAADDPQSKLPADVRQALQRVPDDPGALLRRKFDLEYRQRHGVAPLEDDSQ